MAGSTGVENRASGARRGFDRALGTTAWAQLARACESGLATLDLASLVKWFRRQGGAGPAGGGAY